MTPTQFRQPRQILAGALMGALVVIGIALTFIFSTPGGVFGDLWTKPPVMVWAVMVVLAFAPIPLINAIGYNVGALAPGLSRLEASRAALMRDQSATILRFVMCEAPAIVAVAMAFVVPGGGLWIYATVAPVSLWLMWTHVYPHPSTVARTQEALEAGGTRSYLDELYAFTPWTGTDADVPQWATQS